MRVQSPSFTQDSDSTQEIVRFWSKVDRETGPIHPTFGRCWIFTGTIGDYGYGRFSALGSTRYRAARYVGYVIQVGPIPTGLDLDHLCRTRACVRGSRLEPVKRRVNLLRGVGNLGSPRDPSRVPVPPPPGTEDVLAAVSTEHGVSLADIRGFAVRTGPAREARREIARRLRLAGWSYGAIGAALGGRDHATVIAALKATTYAPVPAGEVCR